jgi:large conductance mechanosensitive channel
MLKGFRDFILRGNVVDLAVAVLIGAAFSNITNTLSSGVIMPIITAWIGAPDFANLKVHIPFAHGKAAPQLAGLSPACNPSAGQSCPHLPGYIYYGDFLNALLTFLIVSAVVYFLFVAPLHRLLQRINGPAAVTTKQCPQCLSEIPLAATRCKFCGEPIPVQPEKADSVAPGQPAHS